MIIAEVNLIAYYLISGDQTEKAEGVRARDPQWVAPSIWAHEFLNILATHVRQGVITRDVAIAAFNRPEKMVFGLSEYEPTPSQVIELSVTKRIATYDCYNAQLAMNAGLRLVTDDKKLLEKFPSLALSIGAFAAGR